MESGERWSSTAWVVALVVSIVFVCVMAIQAGARVPAQNPHPLKTELEAGLTCEDADLSVLEVRLFELDRD